MKTSFVTILKYFLLCNVLATVSAKYISKERSDGPHALNLVATVNGKEFYAEKSALRRWESARSYCSSSGMQLAEISTAEEYNALRNAYGSNFVGSHWTAGRDSHKPGQFIWHNSKSDLDDSFIGDLDASQFQVMTCLYFTARTEPHLSRLGYSDCTVNAGTLCEKLSQRQRQSQRRQPRQ